MAEEEEEEEDASVWYEDLFPHDLCTIMRRCRRICASGGPVCYVLKCTVFSTSAVPGSSICESLVCLGVDPVSRVGKHLMAAGQYWNDVYPGDTPGVSARQLLYHAVCRYQFTDSVHTNMPLALVDAGIGAGAGAGAGTHRRLYHGTTYGTASTWVGAPPLSFLHNGLEDEFTDFGGGLYFYEDKEFAVHHARAAALAADGDLTDAACRPVLVVVDVDMDAMIGDGCTLVAFDGDAWAHLVSACVHISLTFLKRDHRDVYNLFFNADVVQGAVCRNTQDVGVFKGAPAPVQFPVTQYVFRTVDGVESLLRVGRFQVYVV